MKTEHRIFVWCKKCHAIKMIIQKENHDAEVVWVPITVYEASAILTLMGSKIMVTIFGHTKILLDYCPDCTLASSEN